MKTSLPSMGHAKWLKEKSLQNILAMLNRHGEEARIVGGAVRNALLGEPVSDIDIATTVLPENMFDYAKQAGFRAIPTGVAHGTVTVIAMGKAYEVTTLRQDVETHGRHATVAFGQDWFGDAKRRDFTMNALYMGADGQIFDPIDGYIDLRARHVRFIGEADQRITEDYLRILRFFRFHAWYGSGRPEAMGLKAAVRHKHGLQSLSSERIWHELKKILQAPNPIIVLHWMRMSAILDVILPECWGLDQLPHLISVEKEFGWEPDPLLRLQAILPPIEDKINSLAERLRLSRVEKTRLNQWAHLKDDFHPDLTNDDLKKALYRYDQSAYADHMRHAIAQAHAESAPLQSLLDNLHVTINWQQPFFPVTGKDLATRGLLPGPAMGAYLKQLKKNWIESGFHLDKRALLQQVPMKAGKKDFE